MIKKVLIIFGLLVLVLIMVQSSFASETTGTIDTGVETGADGTLMVTPTASPAADTYSSTQSVTLTATDSSGICYTTNGTTPVCAASGSSCTTGTLYSSAISVSSTTTIKTRSCYPNSNSSSVVSHAYTISVPAPPGGGGYVPPTTTTITTTTTTTLPTTTTTTKPVVVSACQWCGFFCTKIESWMSCPTVTLPSGYICTEVNGVCSKVIGVATTTTTVPTGVTTTTTVPPVTVIDIPVEFTFQNNLKQGMVSEDIRHLQRFLNSHAGTQITVSGLGSPGMETNYFGALTKAAVIKFQNMYASEILAQWGLTKGNGYVGQSTRKKLNELLGE